MPLVASLVCGLHRDDRVERAEPRRPRRLSEVANDERHATRELAEVLGSDVVHRLRPIERDICRDIAVEKNLASKLARTRAELEDAKLLPRRQRGAECGEEPRPKRFLDPRLFDP